ncbi:cytochrome P450 [Xylariaceae sp. FL0804]|nr:cytochrome P450 [Xylariaceae sp. FL0804]
MSRTNPWFETTLASAAVAFGMTKVSEVPFLTHLLRILPILLTVRLIWVVLLWPNCFSPLRHIPTVDGHRWWTSQSLRIFAEPRGVAQTDWINSMPRSRRGLIRYRTIFNSERLLVTTPEALAEVLVNKSYQYKKPNFIVTGLKPTTGMGLILAEGEQHKAQRRTLMPSFSFRHIKDLYDPIWTISRDAVQSLTERAAASALGDKGLLAVDIAEWASKVTLDIMCVAGLGQDYSVVLAENELLRKTYKSVFSAGRSDIVISILRLYLPESIVSRIPMRRNRQLQQDAHTLRTICRDHIRQKQEQMNAGMADDTSKDILTVALSYGEVSEDELVDQLLTFLAAGHETTAAALTWAIYLLCVHPQMQAKLRQEVRSHLPSLSAGLPQSTQAGQGQDLASLIDNQVPALQRFCQEVLRWSAPIPLTMREATVDTSILNTPIPAGTRIIISPKATNRDKSLWGEDAEDFDPDRWFPAPPPQLRDDAGRGDAETRTDARSGTRSNYASMTFLHGPRSCIGQSFAKAELAILVAVLVGRFNFSLEDEKLKDETSLRISRGVTNRPVRGPRVYLEPVGGW